MEMIKESRSQPEPLSFNLKYPCRECRLLDDVHDIDEMRQRQVPVVE